MIGLDEKKVGLNNGATIYLFDEIYDTGLLSRNLDKGKIYAVLIPGEKLFYQTGFFNFPHLDVKITYFRKVYRSPADILKCCLKLKKRMQNKKYSMNECIFDKKGRYKSTFKNIP